MNIRRIFFYVQSLLGIGHLIRAQRIAKALARAGFQVELVTGGVPLPGTDVPGIRRHQLTPIKAGVAGFSDLVHADGSPFDAEARAQRREHLLRLFAETAPDILLTEAFPFGRRQMRFELLPLLEAARARPHPPLIACSVRDILQNSRKPGRAEETRDLILSTYDLVLVHGDAALVPLIGTFPLAADFADRIVHTGLVGPEPASCENSPQHDVIVSAGGGAVGRDLLFAALAARPSGPFADARWLVVTGPQLDEASRAALLAIHDRRVEVVEFIADLPQRFRGAKISISQAGYNSAADLLAARCPAVLVPYAAAGESEQTRRASRLDALGLAVHLPAEELDATTLVRAMTRATHMILPDINLNLDGAATTAEILRRRIFDESLRKQSE